VAFRLKQGSISRGLSRRVSRELDAAIEILSGPDVSDADIHEARKHIKKVRSIVKLLKASLGGAAASANAQLRSVGQGLGRVRDAEAMIGTLDVLRGRYSDVIGKLARRKVAQGLRGEQREARQSADDVARHAIGVLRRVRKSLPDRVKQAGGLRAVQPGLASVYKRCRSAVANLTEESDAVAFHDWRRRVKEHWYHVRLFEGHRPALRSRTRSLRALETELGEDHNLAILNAALIASPRRFGDARTTNLVIGCIQKRQRALRKKALARGRRLFVAKPKKIEAAVAHWWRGKR
jgi:CHAD domain-containing protein